MERTREGEPERLARPPEPAPPEVPGSPDMQWASAIGNQAVARLARQAEEGGLHEDEPEDAPAEAQELVDEDLAEDELDE